MALLMNATSTAGMNQHVLNSAPESASVTEHKPEHVKRHDPRIYAFSIPVKRIIKGRPLE
jgi:hypothetical protein